MPGIATALSTRMEERGDDANALAARFGVSQSTISRWLNGKNIPEARRADTLAEYLGVPYEEVAVMLAQSQTDGPKDLQVKRLEAELVEVREELRRLADHVRRLEGQGVRPEPAEAQPQP